MSSRRFAPGFPDFLPFRCVLKAGDFDRQIKHTIFLILLIAAATCSQSQTLNTLVTFDGSNGAVRDNSRVIQGSDGNFYGTTQQGGAYNAGTFFSLTPGGTVTVLYSFCAQVNCADGGEPSSGLIQGTDGNFYGTTQTGGTNGNPGGTVFKVTPSGVLTTLYSFCSQGGSCVDGATPVAGLIQAIDGKFYGTTKAGGNGGQGIVFKITSAGLLTTLYNFCSQAGCTDGRQPEAPLIQAKDGNLYGTTSSGGITNSTCVSGCGTLFKIALTGTVSTPPTLYKFCSKTGCTDGINPQAPLIQAANGLLYGTTSSGGVPNGAGTIYKITTAGALTTVHSFASGAGVALGGVIQAIDGNFYGTTTGGGANAAGSAFKLTSTNIFSTIYSFCALGRPNCTDGAGPAGTLLQAKNGTFYATTSQGGASQEGTVYSLFVPMPLAKISPTTLNFNQVGIGETSPGFPLTLSNAGTGSLSITKIALTGTNKGDFSVVPDPNSCVVIANGNPCTITVTLSPTVSALEKATLTITTNATTLTVALSGTGVNGPVALLTLSGLPVTAINFGSQPAGQQTPSQTVTFTNTGNQTLNISGFSFSGTNLADFQLSSNKCGAYLDAGASCTFGITFTPASVGARSATLTINDNALKHPQTIKLSGTGTSGTGPSIILTLSKSSLLTFQAGRGTVQIPSPACGPSPPPSCTGQQIFLSSNNTSLFSSAPGMGLPTSVLVPVGQVSNSFSFNSSAQSGSAVITAFANNFQNGTATLTVNNRTMTLMPAFSLVGGSGGNIPASLKVTNPPQGILQVALSSADPTVATISPATVQIPSGATPPSVVITGANPGTTTLMATAPGFSQAIASITTTNNRLTMGQNLTIAQCQTLPLSIGLSPPANPINLNLSSTSTPPGVVSLPANVLSNAAQVTGKLIGQAMVYASDPAGNYAPGNSTVTVADTLNFSQSTLEVPKNGTSSITLNLGAPPCSTGFTATLTVDDPTIASVVPSTVNITTGQSATLNVKGLKLGTTHLHASGGGGSATSTINVAEIDLNPATVGAGLETTISGSFSSPTTGAENVTISSSNSNVLLSADGITPATTSISVSTAGGMATLSKFYAIGKGAPGTSSTVTAAASGYASGSANITVGPAGFYIATPSFMTAVGQPDMPITIQSALLDTSNNISSTQAVAPGTSASLQVASSIPSVGSIDSNPVTFGAGASSASTAFHQAGAGSSTISITQPAGFTSPGTNTSIIATVNSTSAGFANATSVAVGNQLELAYGYLALTQPAPSGNLTVMVSTSDPNKVVVSSSNNVLGDGSAISLVVPAGSTQVPPFYIQSTRSNQMLSSQTVNVQVQASGYAQATIPVNLVPSGFVFLTSPCPQASSFSTTDHSTDTSLNVEVDALDPTTLQPMLVNSCNISEPLIPSASSVTVNVSTGTCTNTSSAAVGSLTLQQVMFNPGDGSKPTGFHPLDVGSCTLAVDTPTGFVAPAGDQSIAVTVTAAGLYLNSNPTGLSLESQLSVSLVAPAPPGNETITISSQDPTKVLLSTDPTQSGSQMLNVVVFAGNSSPSVPVYAQAIAGLGSSVNLTATSQDFGTITTPLQIVNSAFVVGDSNCPTTGSFSTTPQSGDTPLTVYSTALDSNLSVPLGGNYCNFALLEPVAPGASPVSVPVYAANPQTGQPDNAIGSVTVSPVIFNSGDASQSTDFHPIAIGTTNVVLTTPVNFTTPNPNGPGGGYQQVQANVTNGGVTVSVGNSTGTIGVNLQAPLWLSLTSVAPSDTVVTISSGDPRLVLSTDPTVQGTASVSVIINAGNYSSSVPIYAQAQYQPNAQPPFSVTLTASAPQFDSTTLTVPIVASGFILGTGCLANGNPNFSTVVFSSDTTVPVYSVPLDATNGSYDFNPYYCGPYPEQLNPNIGPVTIAVVSTNQPAGTITSSPLTFNASPGSDDNVQTTTFHPSAATAGPIQVTLGAPSITGVSPTGFSVPNNFQSANVTVSNPTFYLNVGPVGNNLQAPVSLSTSQPAPTGGEQVTLSVDNGSALVLSTNPLQVGSPTLQMTIPAGQYSPTALIYAQAIAGPSPSNPNPVTFVNLTVSGNSFDPQTVPVSLVPSGFVVAWGGLFCADSLTDPTSTTLYSPDSPFTVYAVPLDPTTLNLLPGYLVYGCYIPVNPQLLNPGVGPITVAITDGNTNIGTINPSSMSFNAGDSQQGSSFHPLSNGTAILTLPSSVSAFTKPSNYQTLTANVSPATIHVNNVFVGQSMEVPTSFYLAPGATSSFTVTVKSGILSNNVCMIPQGGNANLLLSSDPNVTGSTALNLQFNQGDQTSPNFWVQAQPQNAANLPASYCLQVTANDSQHDYQQAFVPASVMKSGFVISNLGFNVVSFNTTVGSADTTLTVSSASLDSNSNVYDFETLIPGVSVQVPVVTSKTCSVSATHLDATYGRVTQSPVVFNGVPEPASENTSLHPVASGGSDVIVVPAATASSAQLTSYSFSQASNENCITANVN